MAGPRRRLSEVTVPSRAQPLFHAGVLRHVFARYLLSTGLGRCVTPSPPAPTHPVLIGSWHCCRAGCDDERESTPRRFFYFRLQAFYTLFPLTACFFTTPFRRPYGRGRCRARRPARQRACAPAGADPRLFQTCDRRQQLADATARGTVFAFTLRYRPDRAFAAAAAPAGRNELPRGGMPGASSPARARAAAAAPVSRPRYDVDPLLQFCRGKTRCRLGGKMPI